MADEVFKRSVRIARPAAQVFAWGQSDGVRPKWRATRVNPVEALRAE